MEGFGRKIREVRESKGLSLQDVEEATKIRKKYLRAIEEERFEEIPGRTYARGFIKNYARFLGLDPGEFLEEFEARFAENNNAEWDYVPVQEMEKPALKEWKPNVKFFRLGVVAAVVLFLIFCNVAYKIVFNSNEAVPVPKENSKVEEKEDHLKPSKSAPQKEDSGAVGGENESGEESRVKGVDLDIEIVDQQCWVRVVSDGKEVFSGTLNQGDKKEFKADSEIVVTLGNAGAARITYNGKELPPFGDYGEVVTPPPFVSEEPKT